MQKKKKLKVTRLFISVVMNKQMPHKHKEKYLNCNKKKKQIHKRINKEASDNG